MVARKAFIGVRLRRLREERKLKQVELAQALGISPSYLNQLEQNQRPLTVPILLKLNAAFGVDVQVFSEDDEARLMTDIRDAIADVEEAVSVAELRELATNMPAVGRTLVALHRRYRDAVERGDAMAAELGDEWSIGGRARQPFEQVRDFFYARHNHVELLDEAAERLYRDAGLSPRTLHDGLTAWLKARHGIAVLTDITTAPRRFDLAAQALTLSASLTPGQRVFQMATQLAFLELGEVIDDLADDPVLADAEARRLGRIGLANYFAGALVLPYADFLTAAEAERYDLSALGGASVWGSRRSVTACRRSSGRVRGACPSSSFASTVRATFRSGNRRPTSTFRVSAGPARSGTSMRHSLSRAVCCVRLHRCPMGAAIYGSRGPWRAGPPGSATRRRCSRLGSAATCAMRGNSSIRVGSIWPILPSRHPSAPGARCASAQRARSGRFRRSGGRSPLTRTLPLRCPIPSPDARRWHQRAAMRR